MPIRTTSPTASIRLVWRGVALEATPHVQAGASRQDVLAAMQGYTPEQARLIGA